MAKCTECDRHHPHPEIPRQRRVQCSACGYKSHWIEGSYNAEHGLLVVNGHADWRDGEYRVEEAPVAWQDGRSVRLTLCCYALALRDLV